jgi:hypothetical protein
VADTGSIFHAWSSLRIRCKGQFSHPYRATDKTIVLYITILEIETGTKQIPNGTVAKILKIQSVLNLLLKSFYLLLSFLSAPDGLTTQKTVTCIPNAVKT